jgi:uncharacterized protein (DUF2147 family)
MRLSALAGLIFVAVSSFSEARGTGLPGTWLTQDGSSKIRFETCGAALCGRLVWLRDPNDQQTGKPRIDQNNPEHNKRGRSLLGMVVLTKIRPVRPLEWSASAYNPEDARTYDVTLTLTLHRLVLRGCVFWGLICRHETWTRVE